MIHKKANWLLPGLTMFALLFCLAAPGSNVAEESLTPYEKNSYFWQFEGEPVLLLGASSEDNPFQLDEEELIQELDMLKKIGVNYLHNNLSSRDEGNSWLFAKHEDL